MKNEYDNEHFLNSMRRWRGADTVFPARGSGTS